LIGVFAVDFNLDDISTYLHRLEAQTRAETMVFLTDGSFLASSEPTPSSPVVLRIQSLLHDPAASHDLLDGEGRIIDEVVDGNESLLVGLRRTNLVGGLQCVSAIVFNRRETFGSIEEVLQNSAATASAAFILSMVVAFFVARRVSMPLRALTNEVRAIGSFKLESLKSPASSIHELKVLSTAVDRMRDSLKSFGHYVPVDIVKDLIRSGGVASLGGERRAVTVMFSDLEGFTKYAEKVTPEAAVETLTEYFEVFGRAIHNEGGVIDKFLGDGVMALFNAPTSVPAHARAACRAALQAKQALIARGGTYVPGTRIGLHVGEALVGNVGTYDRFSYTAIGDCVNLSSRLEGLNKIYGTAIIASDVLVKECGGDEFLWRHLDRVAVSGRDEPLDIYELMNFSEAAGDGQKRVAETHARALDLYLRGEFESAGRVFASISEVDSAASIMIERITVLLEAKPANWSGAFKASK
jgi:adenylate cyclase